MRTPQAVVFAIGILAFVASVFFIGQATGDDLWRTGIAAMLVVIAGAQLWPPAKRG